ncbi:puratrophin-1 [Microcaecilia unicolor]|uniref:Puratrophin-1 n=1 Tax=Microcaecilia unicolor TaxID=1415580 RepID=A0A6P7Y7C7_9AMPH|nr:puratrophin-1 [Microcaecilia unicolor]
MDSESVDKCIQSTLSVLYPPFQATAATILCQVFDVVEKTYRGDGLRYLVDFLIPTKHILQCIQQDTCLQYCGRLFLHEGWPLCMHEKIVVQLASVDWRLLQPADFYLQVVPYLRKTPHIVLKCLSNDNHNIEEVEIPEVSYTSIFTLEWLDSVNGDRVGPSLTNCLLVSEGQLLRVPWSKVVNPEFIEKPKMVENITAVNNITSEISLTSFTAECVGPPKNCQEKECTVEDLFTSCSAMPYSEPSINDACALTEHHSVSDGDSEGEYVELANVSMPRLRPQICSLTRSIAVNCKSQNLPRMMHSKEKQKLIVICERTTSSQSLMSSGIIPNSSQVGEGRKFGPEGPINLCSLEMKFNNMHLLTASLQSKDEMLRKISDYSLETLKSKEAMQTGHSGQSQTTDDSWTGNVNHKLVIQTTKQDNTHFLTTEAIAKIDADNIKEAIWMDKNHSLTKGIMWTGIIGDLSTEGRRIGDSNSFLTTDTSKTEGTQNGDIYHSLIMGVTCDSLSLTTEAPGHCENGSHFRDVQEHNDLMMDSSWFEIGHSQTQYKLSAESSKVACQVSRETILGQTSHKISNQLISWKCSESTGLTSHVPFQSGERSTQKIIKHNLLHTGNMNVRNDNLKLIEHEKLMDSGSEIVGHVQRISTCSKTERQGVAICVEEKAENDRGLKNIISHLATGERLSVDVNVSADATRAEIFTVKANSDWQSQDLAVHHSSSVIQEGAANSTKITSNDDAITGRNENLKVLQSCREEQAMHYVTESEDSKGKAVEKELLSPGKETPDKAKATASKVDCISFLHQATDRAAEEKKTQVTQKTVDESKVQDTDRAINGVKPEQESAREIFPSKVRSSQTFPTCAKDVNIEVLSSGLMCLPGARDKNGRVVVIVSTRNTTWLNPHCNTKELVHLFQYFYSTLRQECQALGLTILVDARRCSPVSALFKAFNILQVTIPNCIHRVLLFVERDLTFRVEKLTATQVDLISSTKSLHRHIDSAQLPQEFDGSFPYCHHDWMNFRLKLEYLQQSCEESSTFLQRAIESLESHKLPHKAEEARTLLVSYTQLMKSTLENVQLVRLQLEGGALLARLKKEESCVSLSEDYRDAIVMVTVMYNKVDKEVHQLVMLANKRMQELELVIEFQAVEDDIHEVSEWIESIGNKQLQKMSELEDTLEMLYQAQKEFLALDTVACKYLRRGQEVIKRMSRWEDFASAETFAYVMKLQTHKEQLKEFSRKLDESRKRIEKTVKLYQFFDKAYEWALEGMRHLACISMEDCSSPDYCAMAIKSLETYKEQHPEICQTAFQEMKELASELGNSRGTKQWQFAWSKCQESKLVFEKKLEVAQRTRRLTCHGEAGSIHSDDCLIIQRRHSDGMDPSMLSEKSSSISYLEKLNYSPGVQVSTSPADIGIINKELATKVSPNIRSSMSMCSGSLATQKLLLCSVSDEGLNQNSSTVDIVQPQPSFSSTPVLGRQKQRTILKKTQSLDLPCGNGVQYSCHRTLSEPARRGNTGVFIKGLEVSSMELVDRAYSPQQIISHAWPANTHPEQRRCSISSTDAKNRGSKLKHILEEMVVTEREYVRSLCYIIENYYPEMDRLDLPQDLRGKRSVIFGNLEKLYDFHCQYFLKELESCCNHPLRVSHCFLRHKDQFGMYALYSKNKPKSDMLLSSHGNTFFKFKQLQLGDKMDLASYLLKPIQRMSKYALLLKDLIKECSEVQEQELSSLRAAGEMVKFQLRHGNDLLAMDTIRDCDVNLKEQGQLVRQDEFTVWLGRKKCQRHVFLFEDLILFSKPKKVEGGYDAFIYKRSFKTADIGLTENSGDSGLRFEIWFRRRKSSDTYVLQASTIENKQMWTSDIAKILWQQATRNKEIRMQEMVSMGVGNKPFLDIKPSDAAINDRAIDYIMKGRGARTRASIAVSMFDHSTPYRRTQMPHSSSSAVSCATSSASLLGPLNLHMYGNQALLTATCPFHISTCIEEDEQEHETSSQPSMTTESSESSQGVSGNGSSGSDSGCVSSIPRESYSEGSSLCGPSLGDMSLEENPNFINRQYISTQNAGQISII